ncbi:uncharacterized protein BCR38DRAFT_338390 [Pseudomassariella vexata]|uniref:Uncharacterized protein n=1 Tax=Pseudomassariella vexata TaxID=1141098 RepID=A0A1Y2E854_9PEZI|nr:uncharacterized protein BCR38DRAFT_338390 [Pseudomassariella vexata]ORY67035.1 hypothetical protein BCR38DRAFT_338390 [Pseudomassariella vexata]
MRSHPYRAPPPLPPLLDELSTYLPNRDGRRANDDTEIPLSDFNPDTSSLLPRKRRQHRVRVQGRLALVRSVSVANLNASTGIPSPRDSIARFDTGITGKSRRRRSIDAVSDMEEDVEERDTQFRGYGIGGAGNIRTCDKIRIPDGEINGGVCRSAD